MPARELIPLVKLLCDITEAQIAAARSLENSLLQKLNGRRIDVLFDLTVALSHPIQAEDPDMSELSREIKRLQRSEARLNLIAGSVVDTLNLINVTNASRVYDRSGRVQE